MKKPKVEAALNKATKNVSDFYKTKTVGEYLKDKLAMPGHKKIHIDEIIDNGIERAKVEEKPEWSKFLFDTLKAAEVKPESPSNNFFIGAASLTNEGLQKIIDVTPAKVKTKSKIEELI